MTHPPASAPLPEPSLIPVQGWHCSHYFYQWDRKELASIDPNSIEQAKQEFLDALNDVNERPQRMQLFIISGHKADIGLIMMDPNPLRIDRVHQKILSTRLGRALIPTYSFVSMSEVSEYLPNKDQYAAKLIRSGEDPESPAFQAKVASYDRRLPVMLAQRLAPEFPTWPAMCFYPMNKHRNVGANWWALDFDKRRELMGSHARTGRKYAGKVRQLVTGSTGLDTHEWSVTLFAHDLFQIKSIIYEMRFDEVSAVYAEFGDFYIALQLPIPALLERLQLT
jgi:chlorite dismutase